MYSQFRTWLTPPEITKLYLSAINELSCTGSLKVNSTKDVAVDGMLEIITVGGVVSGTD